MAKIIKLKNQQKRILLLGEPRCVAETAQLLTKQALPFYILNSELETYQMEQIEDEVRLMNEMMGYENDDDDGDRDIHELYIPFEQHVIFSLTDIPDEVELDAIMEISYAEPQTRLSVLQEFAEEYPSAIIYSSTLTCTATELNAELPLSAQVVGFNGLPGWTQRTSVEIAPSLRTREITRTRAVEFFTSLGMTTEIIEDRVALVLPRMLAMLINEAAFAVMESVASPQDIDTAMKLGVNYPKGLLAWADEIGIDCIVAILDALYNEYKQDRYRTCVLLKQYVRAGWLGKDAGKGFYSYMAVN